VIGGELLVGIWVTVALFGLAALRWRDRSWRQLTHALAHGDVERAERHWRELQTRLGPRELEHPQVRYYEAGLLAIREDWQAALAASDELGEWREGAHVVAALRARCLAELGRAEEAMAAVADGLAAPELTPAARAALKVTGAIVQLQRREFVRALATLDDAAATLPAQTAVQSTCSCYRGEVLRALGRHDEARQAWERTVTLVPRSRRAAHARERLAQPPPDAYR